MDVALSLLDGSASSASALALWPGRQRAAFGDTCRRGRRGGDSRRVDLKGARRPPSSGGGRPDLHHLLPA